MECKARAPARPARGRKRFYTKCVWGGGTDFSTHTPSSRSNTPGSAMFSALRPKKPGYFGGDIYGTAKQATQKHLARPDAELNAEVKADAREEQSASRPSRV